MLHDRASRTFNNHGWLQWCCDISYQQTDHSSHIIIMICCHVYCEQSLMHFGKNRSHTILQHSLLSRIAELDSTNQWMNPLFCFFCAEKRILRMVRQTKAVSDHCIMGLTGHHFQSLFVSVWSMLYVNFTRGALVFDAVFDTPVTWWNTALQIPWARDVKNQDTNRTWWEMLCEPTCIFLIVHIVTYRPYCHVCPYFLLLSLHC